MGCLLRYLMLVQSMLPCYVFIPTTEMCYAGHAAVPYVEESERKKLDRSPSAQRPEPALV